MSVQDRLVLSDAQWERMAPLIIGRPDQRGSTGRDNRLFVEGVLWIVRTGSPWRDLPDTFGVSTGTEVSAIVGFQNSLAGGFGADR